MNQTFDVSRWWKLVTKHWAENAKNIVRVTGSCRDTRSVVKRLLIANNTRRNAEIQFTTYSPVYFLWDAFMQA